MTANSRTERFTGATCSGCDARWTAMRVCHCGGCHQTFGGLTMFDGHRRGGQCLPPTHPATGATRLVDGVWRGPEWDARATFEGDAA